MKSRPSSRLLVSSGSRGTEPAKAEGRGRAVRVAEGQGPAPQPQPQPTRGSRGLPLVPTSRGELRPLEQSPSGGPAMLTQEGDSGESGQLCPASLGEDVGALLERRCAAPLRNLSHTRGTGPGMCLRPRAHLTTPGPRKGWGPLESPRLTVQWGQTKPLMFSTIPTTCSPVFLQKVSSRLTSPTDTACDQATEDSGHRACQEPGVVPGPR